MTQKEQLQQDLKASMLARDAEKTSTLRMLLSAVGYYEIQKGGAGYVASDEDVLAVIQREAKQHKDSIEQFTTAGRIDLVDKEKRELAFLETYLPEQMTEAEVKILVDEAVSQTGATSPQDIGKVMGALMPKVKGKADGTLVSRLVKESLTK